MTPSLPLPSPSTAHSFGLSEHERVRKLEFTLYGSAMLSYGTASFHVSTLQMVILLQFNKTSVSCLIQYLIGQGTRNTF